MKPVDEKTRLKSQLIAIELESLGRTLRYGLASDSEHIPGTVVAYVIVNLRKEYEKLRDLESKLRQDRGFLDSKLEVRKALEGGSDVL